MYYSTTQICPPKRVGVRARAKESGKEREKERERETNMGLLNEIRTENFAD